MIFTINFIIIISIKKGQIMRVINNEEQLKELFKIGVRVGETVAINVGSDLEGTIEV